MMNLATMGRSSKAYEPKSGSYPVCGWQAGAERTKCGCDFVAHIAQQRPSVERFELLRSSLDVMQGSADVGDQRFEPGGLSVHRELALSRISATSNERLELTELRGLYDTLTSREKQIMPEVALGKLNKAIAYDLG